MHVFGAMDRGGAEIRTLEVMRAIPADRVQMEFCTLSGRRGSMATDIEAMGGRVHPCVLDRAFPRAFVRLLQERRPGVVHSHVHFASGAILALAALAGVPVRICHFRTTADGADSSLRRRTYRRAMQLLLDQVATDIVGVSAGVLDEAWPRWRGDARCRVLHTGVDPARFASADPAGVRAELGVPATAPMVVQVGRFEHPKNQPWAVEVMAALASLSPAHLVFVGRGGTPLEREARALARLHGLSSRVHFAGERLDTASILGAADASLLTSSREGLPGVVLESLAAGTPVVAPDLPGVREIAAVMPGIRIRALDRPASDWAQALRDALADAPSSEQRRERRRSFSATGFTTAASAAGHLALWEGGGAPR